MAADSYTNGYNSQSHTVNGISDDLHSYTNGLNTPSDITNGHSSRSTQSHTDGYATPSTDTSSLPRPSHVPVAICGMGMRLPGGIKNDSDLFNFLVNKGDARSVVGEDRYNIDAFYDPHGKHGTINTKHGYFINDIDFSHFDLSMFTLTAAEAEQVDPNHRLVLEVVREAFESAGETNWRGKNIGTYVGMFSEDWQELQHKDTLEYNPYRVLGGLDFALPNRVAYEYDLKGPSMIIKTACSSAGLGLHQALQAIRQGEISSAMVCGTNLIMAPGMTISMSLQMALSPEGSSKTFDASADGYARGEAVTALYIKRLDEAIRDRNPIRAVIRGSASNVDGKTPGLAVPNPKAHEAVIRQAYESAGLDLSGTTMVEAHGTGTRMGDPLETKAIANCFGSQGMFIGAIKPNLGHSEGAAAITSIMKAALSLENRTIIPNIKFNTPNPAIPWEAAKLTVPVEPIEWPTDRGERISVNSYGIGGSNAHFVIDSASSLGLEAPASSSSSTTPSQNPRKHLLLFSANHSSSLKKVASNIEDYVRTHPDRLDDLEYTLSQRREHLKLRSYSIVGDSSTTFEASSQIKSQSTHKTAFVFTGQGAQWVHMGKELIVEYPSFLESIRSMDSVLQELQHAPSWTIEDILLNCDDKTVISQAEYSQPICTALQVALVDLLATWGVLPSAVVGHSSGEIAAAYAAGALTAKEAIIAAFYRGFVCKTASRIGGMGAVGMGKADVEKYLLPGVQIACENSVSSVTVSGDLDALENVLAAVKQDAPSTLARKLVVGMAYHSEHMRDVGDTYRGLIAEHLTPVAPKVPFYSSVRATLLSKASDFDAQYWQDNMENPVLFHSAAKRLLSDSPDCTVHLEVGPHAALSGPLRQTYNEASTSINYLSTLNRGADSGISFLQAVGQLHCIGVETSYPFVSDTSRVLTDLPTYPWHYEKSYWAETRIMKNWRFRKHLPHDLLGLRTLEASEISPAWRNELRLNDIPWVRDHCVGNDIVFPGAGYISMAGEAVYQITNVRDFTIRNMELSKAMVLYNDKPREVVTTLRPQRLTSILDSDWYEFEIVSNDGSAWNKHCAGLVRSGRASPSPAKRQQTLDREVSSSRWYSTMSRVGLNYGPHFVGLENISASVVDKIAAATIQDKQGVSESPYMIHPTTLDLVFQSLTVATCKGIYRDFTKLFLPTFIGELYIGDAAGKTIRINTAAVGKPGTVQGNSYGMSGEEVVFQLDGFKGTAVESSGAEKPPALKSLQLQWKPHFDHVQAGDLMTLAYDIKDQIRHLEKLYVLCAIEAKHAMAGRSTAQPHMEKYRTWLDQQFERFQQPDYPLVEDSLELTEMSSQQRRDMIPQWLELCKSSGGWAPATAIFRAYDEAVNVYEGKTDYLDLLLQDGVLTGIYSWYNDIWDFKDFMQILGHTQPQMRILEIGSGTGGLTAKFLEQLKSDYGERLYLKYTFTDISSGFFVQAKARFAEYQGIEYKALDISKDPLEQGFTAGEYDLIIASNVLHATPWLHETLTNVRTLLHPKGQLFLQELCPITRAMSFIMGQFSGWWLSEDDGRVGSPFIAPDEWDKRLRKAGFSGCHSVNLDNEQPYTYNANIIAKPASISTKPAKVTLLHGSTQSSLLSDVYDLLQKEGYQVDYCQWHQPLPEDQDVISFLDLEKEPLLKDLAEDNLVQFLDMVDLLQQATILWLTPAAQIRAENPHAAQILGMARTIRSELAMSFSTLELENTGTGAAEAIVQVMQRLQESKEDVAELDPDMEYAWANGVVNVGRFHWVPVDESLSGTVTKAETKVLEIGTPGLLQSLKWTGQPLEPLAPDEVNIAMSAVGLNFKDVMIAMGIIPGGDTLKKGTSSLGLEGTGRITEVGSEVADLKIGDRVMTIGCESVGLATVAQRPASLCIKIPDELSDEEAATMPVVYVTVLMFLVEKWKLEKGQSILIHSAAGGVGICAINVAQWLGAKIYATVGTEEKAAFLEKEFGIARDCIFNSRDSSFLTSVMEATAGVGVDMVLNSLSGELLHASWKCVAPHGAMIEIGKRDMMGRGQLALDPFEDNRTFIGGEVARLLVTHKPVIARLLRLTVEQYAAGNLRPITPITTFDAEQAEEAFRFMQKGTHIGKIVIRFPKEDTIPVTPAVPKPKFRNNVTYLLVGGLGGLGKAIASWMASYGAKNLMFLSRSAGKSDEDQAFFKELSLMGCTSQALACDVADLDAVKDAVSQASMPIGGVMQMAMVLRDVGVLGMDIDSWNTATRPKIQGTWNLHSVLPKDMDFFVLFSSVGGTFGYYGQANYASANTFLDSFVQYRQKAGLAASVMDIGPVDEVGYVSRTASTRATLLQTLETLLTEQNFLDSLQLTIARSSPEYAPLTNANSPIAGYQNKSHIVQALESRIPIMDPQNGSMWKRDPRMSIYRNIQQTSAAEGGETTNQLKQFLSSMRSNPDQLDATEATETIARELASCVAGFLMKGDDEMELTSTLSAVGVDSLVAIEVRNWWKQNLGIDASVLELTSGGTFVQLGELAAKRLKEKFTGK